MAQAVRDVMTKNPVTVSESDSAAKAASAMKQADTGAIVVTDSGNIRGLVTDRDIVVRAVAEGKNPADVKVSEIYSSDLETVEPDQPVEEAIRLMREKHIRRVPVVEGSTPVGIVSIGDLALERDEQSALAEISAAPPNQ
jgi:CBS domain-containing protein